MALRRLRGWVVACVALGAAAGCMIEGGGPRQSESLTITRALNADGVLALRNTNGRVVVDTWREPRVRIEAEKSAARQRLADVRVEVSGEGSRVSVDTHLPHGFLGGNAQVKYHVTVPEGARLELETVNGAVEVEGVTGSVRARTTNGSLEVNSTASEVSLRTTNGGIRATVRSASAERLELESVNGSIRLDLPADVRGHFEAQTVNGGIDTDFPLEVSGKWGPKHLSGELGTGGGRVTLRTVNGSVHIGRL
jgi:DUF4097 and DUF4098 domain-containing protein YvlB